MKPIIEIDHVSRIFGGKIVAVDDVRLDIAEGEFITLLGPSGCGKTTLLRMLAGFELPDRGAVRLDGQDVTRLPPYKRDVNMVFQDYALFPHLTIARNVAFGLERLRLERADITRKVEETLQLVGLGDKADRMPHQLSGGQRQRVALARAIIRRPRVLLLDEPLSALDANLREAMQVELKHLHRKLGLTFVMVTHDQTEALVMSDRIVVMHNGRVAQAGTPSELYDRPASTYVANFVGTSNLLKGVVSDVSKSAVTVDHAGFKFECMAVIAPLWVSYLLRAYIWKTILGSEGVLNSFLVWTGILSAPTDLLLYNQFSMVVTLTYIFIPFMVMPIFTALEKIPRNLVEAAGDLGVPPWGTLAKVIWPLSLPGVIAGATFTFCLTFGDFIAPMLVGGPDGVMIANVITSQYGAALNWPLGSALAVVLLIIVLVIIELSDRLQRKDRIGLG